MKKLIQFIPGLNLGGAETLVKEYVRLINKDEFKVFVLISNERANSIYERFIENIDGVKLISVGDTLKEMNNRDSNSIFTRIKNIFLRPRVIKKIIKQIDPDIIHVHLDLLRYLKFLYNSKTKIYYTIHSEVKACFFAGG